MSKNLVNSSDINVVTNGDNISLELNESYYTEDETDSLLSGKVNYNCNHNFVQYER